MDVEKELLELKAKVEGLPGQENKMSMVVFSGELDKQLAAMIIATGAAAMGMKVVMFFTFWGTAALRNPKKKVGGKDMTFKGLPYLVSFALPNFYFHLVTAYNILRHNGVEIGKRDYVTIPASKT